MKHEQHQTDQIIDAINRGIDEHRATVQQDKRISLKRQSAPKSSPNLSQVVEMLAQVLKELAELRAATSAA